MTNDKQLKEKIGIVTKQDIFEKRAKCVFIAIGSNLGNKKFNIEFAKFNLETDKTKIVRSSSYYKSPSWPDHQKPMFINIVLEIRTVLSPYELLNLCHDIESRLGRQRFAKNEPRICDIDIIDYDQQIIDPNKPENLTLPHPRMEFRNFVLLPLFEISKNWKHPIKKVNIAQLISFLKEDDLRTIKLI